jgi:hypothetical protein
MRYNFVALLESCRYRYHTMLDQSMIESLAVWNVQCYSVGPAKQ